MGISVIHYTASPEHSKQASLCFNKRYIFFAKPPPSPHIKIPVSFIDWNYGQLLISVICRTAVFRLLSNLHKRCTTKKV